MYIDLRNRDELRRHFEAEKELADRLRRSTREERTALFRTLYADLCARVPDHQRTTQRQNAELSKASVGWRMALLRNQLAGINTFVEFAPGDCRLAFEVSRHVQKVIAVDISDQTALPPEQWPANFQLVVYDGYHLDVPDNIADIVFSYTFLEHLHPDDVVDHFALVYRILKPGGVYIFATPHRFTGPHDISSHFCTTPQGFHLKEWTYNEMHEVAKSVGFSVLENYRLGRVRSGFLWTAGNALVETMFGILPYRLRRALSKRLFNSVTMRVRK